jgi:hypothetical protein
LNGLRTIVGRVDDFVEMESGKAPTAFEVKKHCSERFGAQIEVP